jgi:hypothetical protein
MNRPVFKATVDAVGHGSVFIGDKDISDVVSGFEVKSKVGEISKVSLSLIGMELDLDIVTLSEAPEK